MKFLSYAEDKWVELLPCSCGGRPNVKRTINIRTRKKTIRISCAVCGESINGATSYAFSRIENLTSNAWNSRKQDETQRI